MGIAWRRRPSHSYFFMKCCAGQPGLTLPQLIPGYPGYSYQLFEDFLKAFIVCLTSLDARLGPKRPSGLNFLPRRSL